MSIAIVKSPKFVYIVLVVVLLFAITGSSVFARGGFIINSRSSNVWVKWQEEGWTYWAYGAVPPNSNSDQVTCSDPSNRFHSPDCDADFVTMYGGTWKTYYGLFLSSTKQSGEWFKVLTHFQAHCHDSSGKGTLNAYCKRNY